MQKGTNQRLIKAINEECGDNKLLADYLRGMFVQELSNSGKMWRWRDVYRQKIKSYSNMGGKDE